MTPPVLLYTALMGVLGLFCWTAGATWLRFARRGDRAWAKSYRNDFVVFAAVFLAFGAVGLAGLLGQGAPR